METWNNSQAMMSPNRQIPLLLKIKVMFGKITGIIGIVFGFFGLFSILMVANNADWTALKYADIPPIANGKITDIQSTDTYVNNRVVKAYFFTFSSPDGFAEGKSYSSEHNFTVGQQVEIEYVEDNSKLSRIKEMSAGTLPYWVVFMCLPHFLIGAVLLTINIIKGRKDIKLLSFGEIAYGKLTRSEPTNMRINKRTVYKMYFEYVAIDKKTYTAVAKTHKPENLNDEQLEKLCYFPWNPQEALLIDSLPKAVKKYFANMTI